MDQSITLSIPSDFDFKSLNLLCDRETLNIEFDLEPLEQLGIDNPEDLTENEALMMGIIQSLYEMHLEFGGTPDPTAEALFACAIASSEFDEWRLASGPMTLQ